MLVLLRSNVSAAAPGSKLQMPASPSVGTTHVIGPTRYRWNGVAWIIDRKVDAWLSETEPAQPYEGMFWANPAGAGSVKVRLGGQWRDIGGSTVVVVDDVAPASPQVGQVWVHSETGVMSVRLPGGWAAVGGGGATGAVIHYGTSAPPTPQPGEFWLDTT